MNDHPWSQATRMEWKRPGKNLLMKAEVQTVHWEATHHSREPRLDNAVINSFVRFDGSRQEEMGETRPAEIDQRGRR